MISLAHVYVGYIPFAVHEDVLTIVTLAVILLKIVVLTVVVCVEVYDVVGSVVM